MGSVFYYYFWSVSQIGTFENSDWSQIGNLETLIGSRAVCQSLAQDVRSTSLSVLIDGEVRNHGFGLPGRSIPHQVDSDKLRSELHS